MAAQNQHTLITNTTSYRCTLNLSTKSILKRRTFRKFVALAFHLLVEYKISFQHILTIMFNLQLFLFVYQLDAITTIRVMNVQHTVLGSHAIYSSLISLYISYIWCRNLAHLYLLLSYFCCTLYSYLLPCIWILA